MSLSGHKASMPHAPTVPSWSQYTTLTLKRPTRPSNSVFASPQCLLSLWANLKKQLLGEGGGFQVGLPRASCMIQLLPLLPCLGLRPDPAWPLGAVQSPRSATRSLGSLDCRYSDIIPCERDKERPVFPLCEGK